jgi:myotubularin-related protein 3/4
MVVGVVPSSVTIVEEEDDIHVCELPTSITDSTPLSVTTPELPPEQTNNLNEYPFEFLSGEELIDQSIDSTEGYIYFTNYRLFIYSNQSSSHCSFINCPIRLIDTIEIKDNIYLSIQCKDIRSFRLLFFTQDKCCYWLRKLNEIISTPINLDDLFAIKFFLSNSKQNHHIKRDYFYHELIRLKLNIHPWRITEINRDYKLSPSYPNLCVVPASITDEEVHEVAKFRSYRRFPTIVWR